MFYLNSNWKPENRWGKEPTSTTALCLALLLLEKCFLLICNNFVFQLLLFLIGQLLSLHSIIYDERDLFCHVGHDLRSLSSNWGPMNNTQGISPTIIFWILRPQASWSFDLKGQHFSLVGWTEETCKARIRKVTQNLCHEWVLALQRLLHYLQVYNTFKKLSLDELGGGVD